MSQWIDNLSTINEELGDLKLIEKQLLKNSRIETQLQGIRRKNTLVMGLFCKYEQALNTEFEYGKIEYNIIRAKEHEKKREINNSYMKEFNQLKRGIYSELSKYKRR